MKHLKLFESFKEKDIHAICREYGIKNYTINEDGSIDVDGNAHLSFKKDLTKLPLKFRNVTGNFYCCDNELTSLEGCPESVGGGFYCHDNELTSLEGCPEKVGGNFACFDNKLITLKGSPKSVGGFFYCQDNQLPSLEGCPEYVGGDFACTDNNIRSFDHLPVIGGSKIFFVDNPINSIWILFKDYNKIELFNYYDIIRDDYVIIFDRLKCFLDEIDVYLYDNNIKSIQNAGYVIK